MTIVVKDRNVLNSQVRPLNERSVAINLARNYAVLCVAIEKRVLQS